MSEPNKMDALARQLEYKYIPLVAKGDEEAQAIMALIMFYRKTMAARGHVPDDAEPDACKKCGSEEKYWDDNKKRYRCMNCGKNWTRKKFKITTKPD